jgi:hypothetical protein
MQGNMAGSAPMPAVVGAASLACQDAGLPGRWLARTLACQDAGLPGRWLARTWEKRKNSRHFESHPVISGLPSCIGARHSFQVPRSRPGRKRG